MPPLFSKYIQYHMTLTDQTLFGSQVYKCCYVLHSNLKRVQNAEGAGFTVRKAIDCQVTDCFFTTVLNEIHVSNEITIGKYPDGCSTLPNVYEFLFFFWSRKDQARADYRSSTA